MQTTRSRALQALLPLLLLSPAFAQESGPALDDASLGAVVDREGSASLRRATAERWALASERDRLEPGDWVKVATRGANALKLRFGRGELLLGPGSLVELVRPTELKVLRGEVAVRPPKGGSWRVHAPLKGSLQVAKATVVRAQGDGVAALPRSPKWLTGYESNESTEAMGSLLAKVDGREVSLSMGYHKVTVDIRDQIARTVIEESFVNHTAHVLEGVFYFPLPADASISGFGMWIGDELVHGEIIEKQRARAIYETILREKRDPGLLEWAGGNIFKARVYPIGHEKRIKITYTQVLPKEGDTYRYHYALQSELLRARPLSKLELKVTVSSATELAKVASTSHPGRTQQTPTAASFEFQAEEFTPERDFELRVTTKPAGSEGRATLVPHQRGDDGYFLCLVDSPPAAKREGPPPPLDVIVIADTSASVNGSSRDAQVRLIEGLLSGLGAKDRFNLLTADTEVRWAFEGPVAVDPVKVEDALAFVEARRPLGWSDLDQAFDAALKRAGAETHVIYVGDGVITTGDADPVAFAKRLRERHGERGHFHAVQPGSGGEAAVLRAIAGMGSGSQRALGGGTDEAEVAAELLAELTTPKVEGLSVDFQGFATAAVYPGELPNLPIGTQQIVIGRFQPQAKVSGKVRVRGKLAGKAYAVETPVAFSTIPGEGNSFVPRLWARKHLDQLLEEGRNAATKKRVIELSEDFQIATPYTSFLVLESEADRERFQVKKRFRMRDGEAFFQKGRDDANYALRQKQLKAAKKWRVQLRARQLEQLTGLNRELYTLLRPGNAAQLELVAQGAVVSVGRVGGKGSANYAFSAKEGQQASARDLDSADLVLAKTADAYGGPAGDPNSLSDAPAPSAAASPPAEPMAEMEERKAESPRRQAYKRSMSKDRVSRLSSGRRDYRGDRGRRYESGYVGGGFEDARGIARLGFLPLANDRPPAPWNGLLNLFPGVGSPRAAANPSWEDPARSLLVGLNRRAWLAKQASTIEIATKVSRTDHHKRALADMSGLAVLGADAWAVRHLHLPGDEVRLSWFEGERRGALTRSWNLGRTRKARDGDKGGYPGVVPWILGDEHRSYASYSARVIQPAGADTPAVVRLTPPPRPLGAFPWRQRYRAPYLELTIDPKRQVVLLMRSFSNGKPAREERYSDFVQVAGTWLPGKRTASVVNSKHVSVTTWTYRALDAAGATKARASLLAPRAESTILGDLPTLEAARQAVEKGSPRIEDRLVALSELIGKQTWDAADPQAAALFKATGPHPATILQVTYRAVRRRNEELRQQINEVAAELAKTQRPADASARQALLGAAQGLNSGQEFLTLLEALRPVVARYPRRHLLQWQAASAELNALQRMGQPERVFQLQKAFTERFPLVVSTHATYARALFSREEQEAGIAYIREAGLNSKTAWSPGEVHQLRESLLSMLWDGYRYPELVAQVDTWDAAETDPRFVTSSYHYNRLLSALVLLDREVECETRIEAWFKAVMDTPRSDARTWSRFQGAVQESLGNGQGYSPQYLLPQRAERLAQVIVALSKVEASSTDEPQVDPYGTVQAILYNWRFRQNDAAKPVLDALYAELETGVETLTLAALVERVEWLRNVSFQPETKEKGWEQIFKRVYARWLESKDAEVREVLGHLIERRGTRELRLARLRVLVSEAKQAVAKRNLRDALFALLLQGAWTAAEAKEAVEVFAQLGPLEAETGEAREVLLNGWLAKFHDLNSWLVDARADAELLALPEHNTLDRRQLQSRRAQLLEGTRKARQKELSGGTWDAVFAPYAKLEALWLGVKLKQDKPALLAAGEALLVEAIAGAGKTKSPAQDLRLRVIASRSVASLIVLLAEGEGEARDKAIKSLIALIEQALSKENKLLEWKEINYSILLVTNELDTLRDRLKAWFGEGEEVAQRRWGRALAFLYAERDKVSEAVAVLERLKKELTHDEWRRLADLYTVLDRRADAEAAKVSSWEQQAEYTLHRALNQDFYSRYQRRGKKVPETLDSEVPLRFLALFRKATQPGNYVYTLRRYYGSTRDFRLLACTVEATQGMSRQGVYSLLGSMRSVTGLLQEEATLDRLTKHLGVLRGKAKTVVDQRALDLLELLVEQKATQQNNGAGPHEAAALAALKRAFERAAWVKDERRLYAGLLASLGQLPGLVAREQIGQLRRLLGESEPGTELHLALSLSLAAGQRVYGQRDDAIATLEAALSMQRDESGLLRPSARSAFFVLLNDVEQTKGFMKGESMLKAEIALSQPINQLNNLKQRLDQLYVNTLRQGGEVSLGREQALYAALRDRLYARMAKSGNEGRARQIVYQAMELMRTRAEYREGRHLGNRRRSGDVRDDLIELAFTRLPQVLDRFRYRQGQSMVGNVSDGLKRLLGAMPALEFLIARAESEPRWLLVCGQDFWSQQGWRLSQVRAEAKPRGRLRARCLTIVLNALRRDLIEGRRNNRSIYSRRHGGHFWAGAQGDFLAAAQDVLSKHGQSEPVLLRAAEYLFHGLNNYDLAIEALSERHAAGRLSQVGRVQLVDYLRRRSKHGQAVPLLQALIQEKPDHLDYRLWLVESAHFAKQGKLSEDALQAILTTWKAKKRWTEGPIAKIARTCVSTQRNQLGADLLEEAIKLHGRSRINRGVGDGTLSAYYNDLARARTQLGDTIGAVDAAAGAVICWGNSNYQRRRALSRLESVMRQAKDLPAYVKHLDAEVAKTGLENPLLRKSIARIFRERKEWGAAAEQLELSVTAKGNDSEAQRWLIECYDHLGRPELAARQLLALAAFKGHSHELYLELGQRYERSGNKQEAERAYTTVIEMQPNEAQAQAAFASLRVKQGRAKASLVHWRQVIRLRSDEPEGRIGLTRALFATSAPDSAIDEQLNALRTTDWEPRFHTTVRNALREFDRLRRRKGF